MTEVNIKQLVNTLIKEAYENRHNFNEAINWGDLKCIEVTPYSLEEGYYIIIDEAAPECPEFQQWIENEMWERHSIDVAVSTEW